MGTTALEPGAVVVTLEEYLRTTYRPDCDYIDGELRERNLGEHPHAYMQGILAGIFRDHRRAWRTRVLTEQRVQTSAAHYRIPDLCVLRSSDPFDGIVRVAPLLCVEVLSRGDSLSEMQERVDDYQGKGVEHVWVVDPWRRLGYVASVKGFPRPTEDVFTIAGTEIRVSLAEVFAEFDEGSHEGEVLPLSELQLPLAEIGRTTFSSEDLSPVFILRISVFVGDSGWAGF